MDLKQKIPLNKRNFAIGMSVAMLIAAGIWMQGLGKGASATQASQTNNTPIQSGNQYKKHPEADSNCPVKGKRTAKHSLYHLPGDLAYSKIKDPVCFETEQQAIDAGFKKSPR